MSRYCPDAIAIAQVMAMATTRGCPLPKDAMEVLDDAERELRHNINHDWMPEDQSGGPFNVPKVNVPETQSEQPAGRKS